MSDKTVAPENENAGLQLNKKSVIGICVLLVVIMAFAGVLTQLLPRGEYYAYPENCFKTASGEIIALSDSEASYKVGGTEELGFNEYIALLAQNSTVIKPVDDLGGISAENAEELSGKIIDGTYHKIDYKMAIWKIPLSIILVFASEHITTGLAIIIMIVLIGGTFLILDERGILKYIMAVVIKKFSNKKYLLLCIMIFICMLLASTAGILEESVTLVPIAAAIALALGWDSLVGLSISLIAVAFGFTAATFNPFNVVTVQKLAGIPVFSGLWFRLLLFVLVYAVLTIFTVIYAKRIEKNPEKSICYETDKALRNKYNTDECMALLGDEKVRKATKAFAACLCGVLVCIVLDFALDMGGYISLPGMALLFTAGGLLAGKISGLKGKALLGGFLKGVKTIAPAIPLIFFILAITYILNEGMIIHTILNYVYGLVQGMSKYSAILLLFAFIVVLEFFIGSGTAKAFLIMPIVAPLSHLIGISGNSVVVTFCMGDGFTNLLYPTSGIMIIAIGLLNISYSKWLRYTWKLFVAEGLLAVAMMHFALFINYA
ncbi:MAG: YfcC family protein [Clostridia bacterium]|nr:YfcC family protein [Clostridia bacterium]